MKKRVAAAEEICGHVFSDKSLMERALTHPSAVEGARTKLSYERLEFLGDSVLGAIVATDIYNRFPAMDEGELSQLKIALVSGKMLSNVAEGLGFSEIIVMGESEKGTGARGMHSALENVYEAVVGALYLDAGYEATHDFVARTLGPHVSADLAKKPISAKSRLQEVTQRDMRCGPTYKLVGEEGPAHTPTFTSVAMVEGRRIGRGQGPSKKASESAAAADALINLGYAQQGEFEGEGMTN